MNSSRWYVSITLYRPPRKLTEARLRKALNATMEVAGSTHRQFADVERVTDSEADRKIAETFEFPTMKDGLSWWRPAPGVVEVGFVLLAAVHADPTTVCSRAVSVTRIAIESVPELNAIEAAVRIDGVDIGRITRDD